jgi:hypothetical protein
VAGPAASGGGGMSTGQGWPAPRSMEPAAVGPAANGGGGMSTWQGLPPMGVAACPRVTWPGGAATQKGSFLANILRGGLFWHFIGAGGLFCQKFDGRAASWGFFWGNFIFLPLFTLL